MTATSSRVCSIVVSGDKLDQRLLRGPAAQERDDVLSVAPPLVLADRLAQSDLNRALCTRRADEHSVARIAITTVRPSIGLPFPLAHCAPIIRQVDGPP